MKARQAKKILRYGREGKKILLSARDGRDRPIFAYWYTRLVIYDLKLKGGGDHRITKALKIYQRHGRCKHPIAVDVHWRSVEKDHHLYPEKRSPFLPV
jgi:hypothetical protein